MAFPRIIYGGLRNFGYLAKSRHPLKRKIKIFLAWLRLSCKYILFARLFNLKKERLFGYTINAFNYRTLKFLFEEIFYRNEYLFLSKNKKPVIFDCGANIGVATLFFKWLYPKSEIYAFEPDKKTFGLLKKNVSQNHLRNVHLFNSAISDKDGEIAFFIDKKNPGSLVMSTKKERLPKDKVTVPCLSLSSLMKRKNISRIDYLKMDIEGSELEAINDLHKAGLLKRIEKYNIEYHHKIGGNHSCLSGFLRLFEKNGFEYQIDTSYFPLNAEKKFQDVLLYCYKR